MIVIPAMDLMENRVVRLQQGDFDRKTVFHEDPLAQAEIFHRAGFRHLHIVDLSGAQIGKPYHGDLIADIRKKLPVSVQVGGGFRSLDQIEDMFRGKMSADDRVMIGSLPFKDPVEFDRIAATRAANILLTVDVWGEEIRISGWKEKTDFPLHDFLSSMISRGLKHFLITQIRKDGMLSGPDFDLYRSVCFRHPQASLIASGGISALGDFQALAEIPGIRGAILGRAYFDGLVNLSEVQMYNGSLPKG